MKHRWLVALLIVEVAAAMVLGRPPQADPSALVSYAGQFLSDLLVQATPGLLMAAGMTLVMITGGIDLSAASTTALVACVMGMFPGNIHFWWTALPIGLATGLALGIVNGLSVAALGVPPIIATLATMILFRGCCFALVGDAEKAPFVDVPGFDLLGRPLGSLVLLGVVYGVFGLFWQRSRWRAETLMIGGNTVAARYCAIPVGVRLVQTYAIMGLCCGLAALAFTGRNSSISPSSLNGAELGVVVAVVLGGTRVQGGAGGLWGTVLGVLLIAGLEEGLRGAASWGRDHLPFHISHLRYPLLGLLLLVGVVAGKPGAQPRAGKTAG